MKVITLDPVSQNLLSGVDEAIDLANKEFETIASMVRDNVPKLPANLVKLTDEDLIGYRNTYLRWLEFLKNSLTDADVEYTRFKEKKRILGKALIDAQIKENVNKTVAKESLENFPEYNQLHLSALRYSIYKKHLEVFIEHLNASSQLLSREQSRRSDENRRSYNGV